MADESESPFERTLVLIDRLGMDAPPLLHGERLPKAEIMKWLTSHRTWRIENVAIKRQLATDKKSGFVVSLMRPHDGLMAHPHFTRLSKNLYGLHAWNLDQVPTGRQPRSANTSRSACRLLLT